ncbi:hypothetical protein K7G98_37360, partial [Saccharothrix sp. MB29]|nr:hypothetical protein [Saccharothrix sp. MB29]
RALGVGLSGQGAGRPRGTRWKPASVTLAGGRRLRVSTAESLDVDFPLLRATIDTNHAQARRVVGLVRDAVGPLRGARLALLGLTFKAGTDDLRDSPALATATLLAAEGAVLTGYD